LFLRYASALILGSPMIGCNLHPATPARVPVGGNVCVFGKPLAGAVVVFLPVDDQGKLAQADTDANGDYSLSVLGFPGGTSPGEYRVAISYFLTPKGVPIGMSDRGAIPPNPDAAKAKELIPARYSDLGRTEFSALVTYEGGKFDFDLKEPIGTSQTIPADASSPPVDP
jgi:hypothetical protein